MNANRLANLSYSALERRFAKITTHKYHDVNGLSQIHVMPKRSSQLEETIYTFEKDALITKDAILRTKDGGVRHIFTNFNKNGTITTIKEINDNLQKYIKTTYEKSVVPLSSILSKRKNNAIKTIAGKMHGEKINKDISVTILRKERKIKGQPAQVEYNILAKGDKQSVKMLGDGENVYLCADNGTEKYSYDLAQFGDLKKDETLNAIFNWFIKNNNGFQ